MGWKRSLEEKQRLTQLYFSINNRYYNSVVYFDYTKKRLIKTDRRSRTKKFYKRFVNKKVRRYNSDRIDIKGRNYKVISGKICNYIW